MAFDNLIYEPKTEAEIFQLVTREVFNSYSKYKGLCFFIKLEQCKNDLSQIIWLKIFKDKESLDDFYFDIKMQRCCILITFDDDQKFCVMGFGFTLWQIFNVYADTIKQDHNQVAPLNLETDVMPTREELNRMVGQLADAVNKTKRKRAS